MTGRSISLPGFSFDGLGTGDLKRYRFTGKPKSSQSFHGNFLECHFDTIELSQIDFTRCDWKDCRIRDAVITDCDLGGASFITNSFENCRFIRCRFADTGISDCEFATCDFINCDLSHVIVKSSKFELSAFSDCISTNRIIESSLLLETRWRGMELEISMITGNFGLKEIDLSDCQLVRFDQYRNKLPVVAGKLLEEVDDWSVLERFRICYFNTGSVDGDADALEKAIDPRNWSGDASIQSSFSGLLGSFSQFLLSEYRHDLMPFFPILKFHTNNFALLDWLSSESDQSALYQTVAGVHLALTRDVENFLSMVDMVLSEHTHDNVLHLAAEGPVNEEYFSELLNELGFSGVRVISVVPRNSPVDLGLIFSDHSWLAALIALILSCRTRVELSSIAPKKLSKKQSIAGHSIPLSGTQLVSLQAGLMHGNQSEFAVNFRTVLPRSLLLELHLGINIGLFKRARETLLAILTPEKPEHREERR